MYLLPNTVVALIWASTFCGIRLMNLRSTLSMTLAAGWPLWSIAEMSATRPISTPLYVTFEPGSIERPDRDEIIVNFSGSWKSPRNWNHTRETTTAAIRRRTRPAILYGGVRGSLTGSC